MQENISFPMRIAIVNLMIEKRTLRLIRLLNKRGNSPAAFIRYLNLKLLTKYWSKIYNYKYRLLLKEDCINENI